MPPTFLPATAAAGESRLARCSVACPHAIGKNGCPLRQRTLHPTIRRRAAFAAPAWICPSRVARSGSAVAALPMPTATVPAIPELADYARSFLGLVYHTRSLVDASEALILPMLMSQQFHHHVYVDLLD